LPASPWGPLEAVPVFLISMLLAGVGTILALLATPNCEIGDPGTACGPAFALITLFTELAFVLAVVFWVRVVNHAPLAILGTSRQPPRDVAVGVLGGLGLVGVSWVAAVLIATLTRIIAGHPPEPP
jgi:hypothetical protein